MPLHPKQFAVNDAWIVVRAPMEAVLVDDIPTHVFVLQDAASCYIFGNAFAPAGHDSPAAGPAGLVLAQAWEKKRSWPKKLVIPGLSSETNGFAAAARLNKIPVQFVSEEEAALYIDDVQSAYSEFLARDAGAA